MNEAFIAALYSAHTAEAQRREKAFDFAKSQMNYVWATTSTTRVLWSALARIG
jgi:hypothetical protein